MEYIELPKSLLSHPGAVALVGASTWTANDLIRRLSRSTEPVLWIEVSPQDTDSISQGNRLAYAVEQAFGSPLFGFGMPYSYGLNILHKHHSMLGSFSVGLYGAEFAPEMAEALLVLQKLGHRVVLCFEQPPKLDIPGLYMLDIRPVAPALEDIPVAVDKHLETSGVFNILVLQKRWAEALEWAVLHMPTQAHRVMDKAAGTLLAQGASERLYRLLSQLPDTDGESLMRWQYTALLDIGRENELTPTVREWLETNESPELRALYAQALARLSDAEHALGEAQRAANYSRSAAVLYHLGSILPAADPKKAVAILRESLRLAESEDNLYACAQSTLALTYALVAVGQFQEARDWAQWGLQICDQKGLRNQQLRLALFSEWAYTRILLGDTAGLESQLRDQADHLAEVRPGTSMIFRTTLAELLLCEQKVPEALAIYRELWSKVRSRRHYNYLAD
jgi:tetratricopeptide (TPR) repeat protein